MEESPREPQPKKANLGGLEESSPLKLVPELESTVIKTPKAKGGVYIADYIKRLSLSTNVATKY